MYHSVCHNGWATATLVLNKVSRWKWKIGFGFSPRTCCKGTPLSAVDALPLPVIKPRFVDCPARNLATLSTDLSRLKLLESCGKRNRRRFSEIQWFNWKKRNCNDKVFMHCLFVLLVKAEWRLNRALWNEKEKWTVFCVYWRICD